MHDKKREVRRYVVRTRLFSLRDPRRGAEPLNGLGYYGEKLPQPAPEVERKPKE